MTKVKKKLTKSIKAPPIEMIEVDATAHFEDQHKMKILEKGKAWYSFWGNKCPVCKAQSNVILVPETDIRGDN